MYSKYPRILLLMHADRAYDRALVMGILKYSRLHGPLAFLRSNPVLPGERHALSRADILRWKPDGVLWREGHEFKPVAALGLPTIFFPDIKIKPGLCNVVTDDRAIGQRAARHLMQRGLKHFAYLGLDDRHFWSRARKAAFRATLKAAGHPVEVFDVLKSKGLLSDWLARLPKPVGLMVCTDDCAMECLSAAGDAGLRIPQDLAVVGAGNDVMVCDFSNPPLSSVTLNLDETGFRAAQRLHDMIRGRRTAGHITAKAFDVVERQSSNFLSVEDDLVVQALQFIHARRGMGVQVKDVVAPLPTSRRALYRKFKHYLGRSIAKEIRRVQMNQAARMLVDTAMPIGEIAGALGFDALHNFSRSFSREKGVTPLKYRNQNSLLR